MLQLQCTDGETEGARSQLEELEAEPKSLDSRTTVLLVLKSEDLEEGNNHYIGG